MTGLVMKHLLKWMNNAEKQINESVTPLFGYMKLRQQIHIFVETIVISTLEEAFQGNVEEGKPFSEEAGSLGAYIGNGIKSYVDNNYSPKFFNMKVDYDMTVPEERQKKTNTIMKSGTPFSKTLGDMQLLLANAFAMPSIADDLVEQVTLLLAAYGKTNAASWIKNSPYNEIGGGLDDNIKEITLLVVNSLRDKFSNIINQILNTTLPMLANARWGLKTINTYHFLKHSHKIKLSSAVQKMFEMTDISEDIEISKRLRLPYPMNYIEFSEALEFSEQGREYQITGALMYEIETEVRSDAAKATQYRWAIFNFPNRGMTTEGSVHALIGVDQMYQVLQEDEEHEYKYQIDKAYFTHAILTESTSQDKEDYDVKMIDGKLHDDYQTWAAGIEPSEMPNYSNPTLNGLTTQGYKAFLQEGLTKIQGGVHIAPEGNGWQIDHKLATMIASRSATDPFYAAEEMGMKNPPTDQKYVVIELIINQDRQNEDDQALFSNVGPYIEIGRRDDGDKWGTVKDGFVATMTNIESAPAKMLEAFKIAMQSIWFINEPDVRLKERDDLLPDRKRRYFPKRKVTKRRKIVLRGEISRYIKTLQQTIRSSPTGAYWVRGHWRNQWYPSIQDHKRKWIMPYIKGTGKAYKKQVDLDPKDEV